MKVSYLYIFIFSLLTVTAMCSFFPASAQDENDPTLNEYKDLNQNGQNSDLNINDEKSFGNDHDHSGRNVDSTRMRSSAATSSLKNKSTEPAKPSSNKEEDALSFNFLYYIIQKFKISDLVDDE